VHGCKHFRLTIPQGLDEFRLVGHRGQKDPADLWKVLAGFFRIGRANEGAGPGPRTVVIPEFFFDPVDKCMIHALGGGFDEIFQTGKQTPQLFLRDIGRVGDIGKGQGAHVLLLNQKRGGVENDLLFCLVVHDGLNRPFSPI